MLAQAISSTRQQTAKQDAQAVAIVLLHGGDAGACGHNVNVLLRQPSLQARHPVGGHTAVGHQPHSEAHAVKPRADMPLIDARQASQAANHAQPGRKSGAGENPYLGTAAPVAAVHTDVRRIAAQRLAEKIPAGRCR